MSSFSTKNLSCKPTQRPKKPKKRVQSQFLLRRSRRRNPLIRFQNLSLGKMVESRLLAALILLGFLISASESLRFELQSGHTKCIVEDMKANAMTVGKYSVVNPDEGQPMPPSHKLTVRVTPLIQFQIQSRKYNCLVFDG